MIDAPLAYAFTAGAVATVNPCGFAMLPAYLSYFLGIEVAKGTEDDRRASVGTALLGRRRGVTRASWWSSGSSGHS